MNADIIPATTERVLQHTDEEINERISRRIEANVNFYATQDRRTLDIRLQELDREWDIERVLEANSAAVSLIGLGLGRLVSRRWYRGRCRANRGLRDRWRMAGGWCHDRQTRPRLAG